MAGLLAAFMLNVGFAKKTPVALVIVLLLSIPLTGCVNDESDLGEITTVSMTIYHGYSIDNATSNHTIEIELYSGIAPSHVDSFVKHVNAGMYDNTTIHRIIDDFMIQGGDFENGDGTGGYAADWYGYCNGQGLDNVSNCTSPTYYTLPDEADNGWVHTSCKISMAKTSQPNTGGSQFFLIPGDVSQHTWLDGIHTVFGEVVSGCEHITTLSEVQTDGYDRPILPVIIASATVVANSE